MLNFLLLPFSLLLYNGSSLKNNEIAEAKHQHKTFITQSSNRITYHSLRSKYDTLIPIFDGLFVTCRPIDSSHYAALSKTSEKNFAAAFTSGSLVSINTRKWGVIDSAGHVIVPFICDGAKEISEDKGIVSVFSTSFSLNTGLPRYKYFGIYYFFNKTGILYETKNEFSIKVEFIADWHNPAFVIRQGPAFYLPDEYRKVKR